MLGGLRAFGAGRPGMRAGKSVRGRTAVTEWRITAVPTLNLTASAGIRWSTRRWRQPIQPATDRSLVDRARHGDLDAFEEIVRARMDAVYRLSFAILGDEADARDAAQDTFVTAWRQVGRLRDADRFDAWLQRVAVNAARMAYRARRRRGIREIPSGRIAGVDGPRATASPADADATILDSAMRQLPVEQRSILVLHHLEGQPVTALAEILEIPVGTVKSRLHTARQALQAAIDAERRDG
jgi:RNA polymerase sigma-70 factor, ECF subfamily